MFPQHYSQRLPSLQAMFFSPSGWLDPLAFKILRDPVPFAFFPSPPQWFCPSLDLLNFSSHTVTLHDRQLQVRAVINSRLLTLSRLWSPLVPFFDKDGLKRIFPTLFFFSRILKRCFQPVPRGLNGAHPPPYWFARLPGRFFFFSRFSLWQAPPTVPSCKVSGLLLTSTSRLFSTPFTPLSVAFLESHRSTATEVTRFPLFLLAVPRLPATRAAFRSYGSLSPPLLLFLYFAIFLVIPRFPSHDGPINVFPPICSVYCIITLLYFFPPKNLSFSRRLNLAPLSEGPRLFAFFFLYLTHRRATRLMIPSSSFPPS